MIDHSLIFSYGRVCLPRHVLLLPGRAPVRATGAATSEKGVKKAPIEAKCDETQVDEGQGDGMHRLDAGGEKRTHFKDRCDGAAELYSKERRYTISREITMGLLSLSAAGRSCGGAGSLFMNLAACVDCVLILDDPAVVDREHALGLIVDHMAAAGLFPRTIASEIRASIMRREELGPTGIGEGVAIPHTWHPAIDRTMGTLTISHAGLEFEALDHKPVHMIFLLLTPAATAGAGSAAAVFETVLRHLKDPTLRSKLRAAADSEDLWKAIRAVDQIDS